MQLLEAPVGGRVPAPGVGAVHQVVVHQGAGVEQLQRGGGPHHRVVCRRAGGRIGDASVPPVAEGGAEPLATADRLAGGGHQFGDVRSEGCEAPSLLRDEPVQDGLHRAAKRGVVPGRVGSGSRHGDEPTCRRHVDAAGPDDRTRLS